MTRTLTLAALAAFIQSGAVAPAASAQTLAMSVDSLAFAARVGGPNPPPQTIATGRIEGGPDSPGYALMAAIPSCVLMYKHELPLMFPDDADVATIRTLQSGHHAQTGGFATAARTE